MHRDTAAFINQKGILPRTCVQRAPPRLRISSRVFEGEAGRGAVHGARDEVQPGSFSLAAAVLPTLPLVGGPLDDGRDCASPLSMLAACCCLVAVEQAWRVLEEKVIGLLFLLLL